MLLYYMGVMCSNPGGGTSQYSEGFLRLNELCFFCPWILTSSCLFDRDSRNFTQGVEIHKHHNQDGLGVRGRVHQDEQDLANLHICLALASKAIKMEISIQNTLILLLHSVVYQHEQGNEEGPVLLPLVVQVAVETGRLKQRWNDNSMANSVLTNNSAAILDNSENKYTSIVDEGTVRTGLFSTYNFNSHWTSHWDFYYYASVFSLFPQHAP